MGQPTHILKFINKLCNTINMERQQAQLLRISLGGNIASNASLQFQHGLAMKIILESKVGLLILAAF